MKHKNILYATEQNNIIDRIVNILNIKTNEYQITLYEIDNNEMIKSNLLLMLPEIKKYFSVSTLRCITNVETSKRPYLSIIKNLLKDKYNIYNSDTRININGEKIRTTKYVFIEKKV